MGIIGTRNVKKKIIPKESKVPIVASVTYPDGSRQLEIVIRSINVGGDSTGDLKIDTQYFLKRSIPTPTADSSGKRDTIMQEKYFQSRSTGCSQIA